MGGNNECSAEMDGKRAAVDLAMASRPEDFTHACYNIDQKLNSPNSAYNRGFVTAMNNELQDRNLLPTVGLNMVAASDTPAMRALQNNKHVETQDLVKAEDQLGSAGRTTEAMLMHRLSANADAIHDTHAERNFWGKNHGGIDMDRLKRWAGQSHADIYGAMQDLRSIPEKGMPTPQSGFDLNPIFPDLPRLHKNEQLNDAPRPTEYDKKQDAEQQQMRRDVDAQKKALDHMQKADELKAKVEQGVIKDAHHTVRHGETLYDMACLALHRAGRDHMTPQAIRFEQEKIRALNHLGPHESLRSGQSLMLRTEQEVEPETARRIKSIEQSRKSSSSSEPAENSIEPVRRDHQYRPNNGYRQYSPVPRVEYVAQNNSNNHESTGY